jgi:hypothetical protein
MTEELPANPSREKGLTVAQKRYAQELFIRVTQGNASVGDMETLRRFRQVDETEFIQTLLDSALVHPDFNLDGAGVDNIHKNALLRERMMKTKHQVKQIEGQTAKLSIDVLNKLRAYNKPKDGKLFGDKRHSQIIDVPSEKEEVKTIEGEVSKKE